MEALTEFSTFLDYYPETSMKAQAQDMIFNLQDKLVEKEFLSAKMYYDLGSYLGNMTSSGCSNYESCIVTAQNALKDYPYASPSRKEELSILVLRSKYHLARQSVVEKRIERFRDAIDEYYAFENEFPESQYMREAKSIFNHAERVVSKKGVVDEVDVESDVTKTKKSKKNKSQIN
jgi:outer membrane protein assembly factor BamD